MMRARSYLNFIFLAISKKEKLKILSLEGITSTPENYKPAKCNLSFSQLFVTSPHLKLLLNSKQLLNVIIQYKISVLLTP